MNPSTEESRRELATILAEARELEDLAEERELYQETTGVESRQVP
jgi:hypothetical protein